MKCSSKMVIFNRFPFYFRTCLERERFTKTNRRRSTGRQPGTKSVFCPADKPQINRWSTGHFVPPSVYIGFSLFVLLGKCGGNVPSMPWKVRRTFVSWENNSVGAQSCPIPPGRSARRSNPTCQWYVCFFGSTNVFSRKALH